MINILNIKNIKGDFVSQAVYDYRAIFNGEVSVQYLAGLRDTDLYIESIEFGERYIHMTIGTSEGSLAYISLYNGQITAIDDARKHR